MAKSMGPKKKPMATTKEPMPEYVCPHCGELKKKSQFYVSSDPAVSIGVAFPCKDCAERIARNYNPKSGKFGEVTLSSLKNALCYLDKPFLQVLYEASYNEVHDETLVKPKTNLWSAYIVNVQMKQYKTMRWRDGDVFDTYGEDTKKNFDTKHKSVETSQSLNDNQEINEEFEKNKNSVIRLLGYDPFGCEKPEDQPLLYSQLIGYLDSGGDSNEDMMRTSSAITIVRGFSQQAKIDDKIARAMANTSANTAELKTLLDAKKNLSATISQLAEQSCLSLKHNKNASKGENTWTGKIKKLRDLDLREAEVNGFDIGTCRGMQQVLEISDASILKQLALDESEWSEIVADQRKLLTKVQRQRDVYKEINRVLLRENLDLRDTLEENEILDINNLRDLKDLFSPLAAIEAEKEDSEESDETEEAKENE